MGEAALQAKDSLLATKMTQGTRIEMWQEGQSRRSYVEEARERWHGWRRRGSIGGVEEARRSGPHQRLETHYRWC
jgi:hypothetical protein